MADQRYLAKARALGLSCVCIDCLREHGVTPPADHAHRHKPPGAGEVVHV